MPGAAFFGPAEKLRRLDLGLASPLHLFKQAKKELGLSLPRVDECTELHIYARLIIRLGYNRMAFSPFAGQQAAPCWQAPAKGTPNSRIIIILSTVLLTVIVVVGIWTSGCTHGT